MDGNIQQAVAAIRAGDKARAYRLLSEVIQTDPQAKESETAWVLMSTVVEDPGRRRQSLEAALAINPHSEIARRRLAQLEQESQSKTPVFREETKPAPIKSEQAASTVRSPAETGSRQPDALPIQAETKITNQSAQPNLNLSFSLPQIAGMVGVFMLLLGVFTPIISLPIVGQMNYFQNGRGDGVFVLLLAAVTFGLILLRRFNWLWITGFLSLTLIGSTLLSFVWTIAQLQRSFSEEVSGDLFGGFAQLMLESVQLQWGWVLLLSGAVIVLATALIGWEGEWPLKHIIVGLAVSFVLLVVIVAVRWFAGESVTAASLLNGPATSGSDMERISVGEPAIYASGTLTIRQLHRPTAFHVIETSTLGHEGADWLPGTEYLAIEMEFTCSEITEVVCEAVPEANLQLELADGRLVDDDWSAYDAPRLGEEDVSGGASTTGWRVFRIPENIDISGLVVDPFSDDLSYHIALPEPVNGYTASYPWIENESGRIQLVPELRRRLREKNIDASLIMRTETDSSESAVDGGLFLELCAETSFHFDEDDALNEHRRLILDTAEEAVNYLRGGEFLLLTINDCSSFATSEVSVGFRDTDLSRWQGGTDSDAEFLSRAIVVLE